MSGFLFHYSRFVIKLIKTKSNGNNVAQNAMGAKDAASDPHPKAT